MSIPRKPVPSYVGSLPGLSTYAASKPSPESLLVSYDYTNPSICCSYDDSNDTTDDNTNGSEREDLMKGNSPSNTITTQTTALLNNRIRQDSFREKTVKWGSHKRQPLLMAFYTLSGIVMALCHHFFYLSLNAKLSGSATRQQWATAIGTGFSFLAIALFRTAVSEAYNQYVWTLVRRKSFKLRSLDKLFAMTSSPVGFLSLELLQKGKIALLLALQVWQVWCMALAGVTPPGTLAVVPGQFNTSSLTSWPTFNWSSPNWTFVTSYYDQAPLPTPLVLGLAMQTAESMEIVPITPPASNASYSFQFYGPALQCEPANSTQVPVFEYYTSALANMTEMIFTKSSFENMDETDYNGTVPITMGTWPFMLQYSAFAPILGFNDGVPHSEEVPAMNFNPGDYDQFNAWAVELPTDFLGPTGYVDSIPLQLWLQTSNESMVCTLMNSSFQVDFEYTAGTQRITPGNITYLEPVLVGTGLVTGSLTTFNPGTLAESAYMSVFIAMTNVLNGNVTTTTSDANIPRAANTYKNGYNITQLSDSSSRVLLTGLTACEDFTDNFWIHNPISQFQVMGDVPLANSSCSNSSYGLNSTNGLNRTNGLNSTNGLNDSLIAYCNFITFNFSMQAPVANYPVFANESNCCANSGSYNYTNDVFTKPAWMCRNKTLARAIEDLSQNITISMLSSSELITPNATVVNVTYFPTHNMYQYDSRNLILSYGIAISVTLLGVSLGLYSFHTNGVSHSMAFSAVVGTTRNPALNVISEYEDKELMAVRLKLGPAHSNGVGKEKGFERDGDKRRKRLAFVLEGGEGSFNHGFH